MSVSCPLILSMSTVSPLSSLRVRFRLLTLQWKGWHISKGCIVRTTFTMELASGICDFKELGHSWNPSLSGIDSWSHAHFFRPWFSYLVTGVCDLLLPWFYEWCRGASVGRCFPFWGQTAESVEVHYLIILLVTFFASSVSITSVTLSLRAWSPALWKFAFWKISV